MATYLMSDIHGCYEQYRKLLEKINFTTDDELYVLGDAVDRGPEPIKLLLDLMSRENVSFIMGNHDAAALMVLRGLAKKITEESISEMTADVLEAYSAWMQDGGEETARQFRKLSRSTQRDVLSFLEDSPFYETVVHDGKLYILVHGGLENFSADKELDEYAPDELTWGRPDYDREYFPGGRVFLVTGHTPTVNIRKDGQPLVYKKNGHIAIDCGCAFGGNLAAYCIETGETVYVEGVK